MKIAYLIVAHNNPIHLNRLINALNSDEASFFIHIDEKSPNIFNLPQRNNIFILNKRLNVYWGGYSQVDATIRLLKKATEFNKYDYYVLLSGVDYPVKSNKYIKKFFEDNNSYEFIDIYKMPLYDKSLSRIQNYNIESLHRYVRPMLFISNKIINLFGYKRKIPEKYSSFVMYAGSNWWALSKACVNYVLNFIDSNPQFVKFYKHTYNPDEMFFHTIIGNSPFIYKSRNSLTYADWTGKIKPALIDRGHMEVLKKEFIPSTFNNFNSYILFARKFYDNSGEIIKLIDSVKK